ncbi:Spore germination protein B1 [Pelotomaculum schinkii]|uniref:Spore germination protein B1 n=2 Tax=Pelotomaculum schinkii TaxID=78350 RepID=A0A4Y7R8I1_9FIRM|nr:Spore germination protein B1 [Pelotomaculum schinkii]
MDTTARPGYNNLYHKRLEGCSMINTKKLLEFISYKENPDREGFILKETADDQNKQPQNDNQPAQDEKPSARRAIKKTSRSGGSQPEEDQMEGEPDAIRASLSQNKKIISKLYGLPENKDFVIREFAIGTDSDTNCFAVFIDGLTDKAIQDLLFQALMLFVEKPLPKDKGGLVYLVREHLLPGNQVAVKNLFSDVLTAVNMGDTAIFLEGSTKALLIETKGWEHRGVERPQSEQVVRGPQEAFTETLRTNTALLRKTIRNEQLTTEMLILGDRTKTIVAIMYLRDLANPDLVAEVKRRLDSIKTDYIAESGILSELIEDHPYNLNPTILTTERPDRVASKIVEGRVAIIVDGSPFVLVVPTTLYEQLHTGEESYIRWQYGTYLRYLRALAFLVSFLAPGIYLAIVLFHHEMIPTELLLAIAGNREKVPFPSLVEVLLMGISFELIREAGIRLPGVIGGTIGIVGALILGQAAVQANIVSPFLVILVAITGLASFAIPDYSLSFAMRIYSFMYIILGVSLGFFGIAIGIFSQMVLTANLKSFGVPYLAPVGPRTVGGVDVVYRMPLFSHEKRPDYINPQDITRQPQVSRGWIKDEDGGKNG